MSTQSKSSYSPVPLLTSLTSTVYTSLLPRRFTSATERFLEAKTLEFVGAQVKVGRLRVVGLDGIGRDFGPGGGVVGVEGGVLEKAELGQAQGIQLSDPLPTPPYSKAPSSTTSTTPGSPSLQATIQPSLTSSFSPSLTAYPSVTLTILSPKFYLRLLTSGDLGFAESYMAGEFVLSYTGSSADLSVRHGQALDEEYYGKGIASGEPEKGVREGEGLLDLFKIIIHSDHPAAGSISGSTSATAVGLSTLPSQLLSALGSYFRDSKVVNSVKNSRRNISLHYDLSNRMFESFLSREMTYSSAIFPSLDSDLTPSTASLSRTQSHGTGSWAKSAKAAIAGASSGSGGSSGAYPDVENDELEEAQRRKLRHIIRKAGIEKGMRVLEIGSGWGSFAMEAVRTTGCTVDTITLSSQQKILAEARIAEAGLTSSITVHLVDFRSLPKEWAHSFDRLVSIEMLEAVGKDYIEPYFKMIDEVLNERGVACFQVITIPESRFESYSKDDDFIRKYIFPGGFLPSVTFTTDCIRKGAQGRLVIDSIVNIGPHYARTLREWRIRFLKNFERDIIPALRDEHPEMSLGDIEVFRRKWIYYFVYCEVGFAERIIGDHIFTLTREGNTSYGCNVFD